MSSTHTYPSEKSLPYVYLCTHKETKEFYIGSRTSSRITSPSHIDFPKYKTSSKRVKPRFHEFDWYIVAEFFNKEDAYKFEHELINENWGSPLMLNESCYHGKQMFTWTNESMHKARETLMTNYGVDSPGKTEKSKQTASARMSSDKNPAYSQTQETKEKIKNTMLQQMKEMTAEERSLKFGTFGEANPFHEYNKTVTIEERKERVAKYDYSLLSPFGIEFTTISLKEFCELHNLNRDILMKYVGKGKIPTPRNFGYASRMNTIGWEIYQTALH